MTDGWRGIAEDLAEAMGTLPWGSFVIVDYDAARLADDCPYVQVAPGPSGWYAEIASEAFVPAGIWPLDRAWLSSAGWNAPDAATDNWWRDAVAPEEVVEVLLDGLRCARTCLLPELITFRTGRFPPTPRGGEPRPMAPATPVRRLAA